MKGPTHERLREVLSYDPVTGDFTWLKKRGRKAAGQIAGSVRRDGYLNIRIDKQRFFAHRLAWFFQYGKWPEGVIDHINRGPLDNRIANLRDVTQQANMHNQGNAPQAHNKRTGLRGVRFHRRCTLKPFQAAIKVGGRVKSLGYFANPEEAHAAYLTAKAVLHKGV